MVGVGKKRKMRAEAECCLGERVDGARPKVVKMCRFTVSGNVGKASVAHFGTLFITPGSNEPIAIE